MENGAPVDGLGIEVKIKNGKTQTLRNTVSWESSPPSRCAPRV